VVEGDNITVDLLVWRRYRIPTAGTRLVEIMLDLNPHLAKVHRSSPFIPPGTQIRIPIAPDLIAGRPGFVRTMTAYGEV
jgi:phage tail protein X